MWCRLWVKRAGNSDHLIIADTFNNEVGPIFGLRIEADGSVVKANRGPWERAESTGVPAHCSNGLDENGAGSTPASRKAEGSLDQGNDDLLQGGYDNVVVDASGERVQQHLSHRGRSGDPRQ